MGNRRTSSFYRTFSTVSYIILKLKIEKMYISAVHLSSLLNQQVQKARQSLSISRIHPVIRQD